MFEWAKRAFGRGKRTSEPDMSTPFISKGGRIRDSDTALKEGVKKLKEEVEKSDKTIKLLTAENKRLSALALDLGGKLSECKDNLKIERGLNRAPDRGW